MLKSWIVIGTLLSLSLTSQAQQYREGRDDRGRGPGQYNDGRGGSCSQDELNRAAMETERATLDRVRQDMRAEGRVQASSLGQSEQDCLNRATERANQRRYEAIDQCVSRTTYFRNCEITQSRTVQSPTLLTPVRADGKIDEKELAEVRCRQKAQDQAAQNALNQCQSLYGMACRLVGPPSPATFDTEKRRRYGIAGPKEEYSICKSTAQALPDSPNRFQCTVEIVAQIRL